METVVLIVDLLIALSLIGVVLLQRSEGGGLGMGGGGGGGVMTGRAAADVLGKVTWGLGTAFFVCTLALTIISANNSAGVSVVDRIQPVGSSGANTPDLGTSLLPPSAEESGPVVPNAEDTDAGVPNATTDGFALPEAGAAPESDLVLPQADESAVEEVPEATAPVTQDTSAPAAADDAAEPEAAAPAEDDAPAAPAGN
ncbi:preprotein translocase subunit SecG [Pseudoroseicyclus sp. H15]